MERLLDKLFSMPDNGQGWTWAFIVGMIILYQCLKLVYKIVNTKWISQWLEKRRNGVAGASSSGVSGSNGKGNIENIKEDLDVVKKSVSKVEKSVGAIHTALIGDLEKKGLITRVRENEDFISACRERRNQLDTRTDQ